MLPPPALDDLVSRIQTLFAHNPLVDVQANLKAMLHSALNRMDVVTREEFEVQKSVLAKTRAKLDALEARLSTPPSA